MGAVFLGVTVFCLPLCFGGEGGPRMRWMRCRDIFYLQKIYKYSANRFFADGYSAPLDFSTAPSSCEKSAVLETRAVRKGCRAFAAASTNPIILLVLCFSHQNEKPPFWVVSFWWEKMDSNHRSRRQQIYSLPPLAAREFSHI